MTWMLPSALALLIKCVLFFYSNVHKKKYIFIFLVSTFFLNMFELSLFFRIGHDFLLLKLYYCAGVFSCLYLLMACSEISQKCQFIKNDFSLIVAGVLAATILFTEIIISDFIILPNKSLTRVAGEYYSIFQIYALSCLIFSLFLLSRNATHHKDATIKKRCRVALFAFVPFITLPITVIVLMQLGYKINAVGTLSLATCFMLFVFISLSEKHKLFTMMKFVPFSQERAYYLELRKHIEKLALPATGEYINMKSILKEVEMVVIRHTHQQADSQKEVARRLSLSESSLSKKMSKKS